MAAKRKPYTREFKDEAVRLATTTGKSIAQVARELEVSVNSLHDWIRQSRLKQSAPLSEGESSEQQIQRLKRENDLLREEAAILKKAIAYFAQPPKK
jgi:transposase